jgi:hypothetical protein
MLVKLPGRRLVRVRVPKLPQLLRGGDDLYRRSRARFARKRSAVEAEIEARMRSGSKPDLDDWQ